MSVDLGLATAAAAGAAIRVTVGMTGNGWLTGATAIGAWMLILAIREKQTVMLFKGKEKSDIAYIGAMLVFLAAWSMRGGLLPAIALSIPSWFLFLEDRLVLPDDEWLKKQLANDMVDQTVAVQDLTEPNSRTSTLPRRLSGHEEKLQRFHKDCGDKIVTVRDILERTRLLYPTNQVTGTRKVLPDGTLGKYSFNSYREFLGMVENCERRIAHLDRVGLYAKNCEEYLTVMLAALHAGVTVIPLYDSLGQESVRHIVNHAELTTVFVSEENLELVLRLRSPPSFDQNNTEAICSKLENVYVFKDRTLLDSSPSHANRGPRFTVGLELRPFEELTAPFNEAEEVDHAAKRKLVRPEDLAFILYTSGTTGVPKGVMLTHEGIVASASALVTTVVVHESDVHLSYLPLAHAFEIAVIIAGLMRGASVGFFHGNVKELTDDAKVLQPTMFIGVPRVFSRVQQVILQQFALKPLPIRKLCYHAVRSQIMSVRKTNTRNKILDALVFSQVKAALGGRVRIMCTGSAPLAPSVQEFIMTCFDVPMVEGYGLTEVSGISHAQLGGKDGVFDPTVGHVGPPLACSEYKLESVPELGYSIEDKPHPRGEVLVRGPNVFKGYYKNEEMTAEVLSCGWFKTGDIGRINSNGTLSIIDRKKNIFKLAQGEYVAPESLETLFSNIPVVGQIYIHGNSYMPHLVALVVPDPLELIPRLKRGEIPEISSKILPVLSPQLDTWLPAFTELCQSPEYNSLIKDYVLKQILKCCDEAELPKFMWPRDIMLECKWNNLLQGFSIANDCLTPTFKLKRKGITKLFGKELDNLLNEVPEKPTPSTAYPPASTARS